VASDIKIKRSGVTVVPTNLKLGELAYSFVSSTSGGDRLYIGTGAESADGFAVNIDTIGGKFFTDKLDHAAGTLTALSAIIVDSNLKIDQLNIDNININGNEIISTNTDGEIILSPNGNGIVNVGSSRIGNVATPTASTDAATKGYVDTITGGESLVIKISTLSDSSSVVLADSNLQILGGTGLTSAVSSNVITINLDNTAVTAGTYGNGSSIPAFTVDSQGRITNVSSTSVVANIDSALVSNLVDSAYIQSRQLNFDQLLDSSEVIQLVDSSYVQARQSSLTSTDNLSEGSSNLYYTKARSDSDIGEALTSQGYNTVKFDSDFGTKSTNNLSEGSTNLYYTQTRFDSALTAKSTSNLSEGSNLYYTSTRTDSDARNAISALDNGGDGSFTYNNATGAFTYTGPSASEVRNHFSAGTGVTISSGQISLAQSLDSSSTPTFGNITTTGYLAGPANFTIDPAGVGDNTGTVIIAGNLQVDGTQTVVNSTTLSINDKNIVLADSAANAAAADGAGITINGANATLTYAATGDKWVFNKALDLGTKNLTTSGTLNSHTIPGGTGTLALTSNIPSNTDGLSEGSTNLYYTTARHDSDTLAQVTSTYVQARQDFTYSSLTGAPTVLDSAAVNALVTAGSADSATITALVDSDYISTRRPAETVIQISNAGSGAYTFSGDGFPSTQNNPTLYLIKGMTYELKVNANGHPFYIKSGPATGTGSQYTDGVTNNGTQSGTIKFTVPFNAPNILYYICQYHSSMVGLIYIIDNQSFLDSDEAVALIDSAYVQARQSVSGGGIDSAAVSNLIDSSYIQLRQLNFDQLLDSSEVIQLIDSSYVAARSSPTLTVRQVDSADNADVTVNNVSTINFDNVTGFNVSDQGSGSVKVALGSGYKTIKVDGQTDLVAVGEDTLEVEAGSGIILSTNASSNPKALNVALDSAFVVGLVTANSTDSATITALVDSAYIQARQSVAIDSAAVSTLIDSDYIQLRQTSGGGGIDSAAVTNLIDSSYLQVRTRIGLNDIDFGSNKILYSNNYSQLSDLPAAGTYHGMFAHVHGEGAAYYAHAGAWIQLADNSALSGFLDSALTIKLIDSAHVQARQSAQDFAYGSLTGAPTIPTFGTNFVDSGYVTTQVNNLIDAAPGALNTLNELAAALGDDASFSTTITNQIAALPDSAQVSLIVAADVDSAYVQARQSASGGGIDSAAVTNLIDSDYIQLRQTSGGGSGGIDSAAVTNLIDSNYVEARVPVASSGALGGLSNVSTTGQAQGSIIIYNGSSWVIDQNAFVGIDGGVATFVDEGITDECGAAATSYSTRDRVDCGTAFAA